MGVTPLLAAKVAGVPLLAIAGVAALGVGAYAYSRGAFGGPGSSGQGGGGLASAVGAATGGRVGTGAKGRGLGSHTSNPAKGVGAASKAGAALGGASSGSPASGVGTGGGDSGGLGSSASSLSAFTPAPDLSVPPDPNPRTVPDPTSGYGWEPLSPGYTVPVAVGGESNALAEAKRSTPADTTGLIKTLDGRWITPAQLYAETGARTAVTTAPAVTVNTAPPTQGPSAGYIAPAYVAPPLLPDASTEPGVYYDPTANYIPPVTGGGGGARLS